MVKTTEQQFDNVETRNVCYDSGKQKLNPISGDDLAVEMLLLGRLFIPQNIFGPYEFFLTAMFRPNKMMAANNFHCLGATRKTYS